jgi:hypothetical protein
MNFGEFVHSCNSPQFSSDSWHNTYYLLVCDLSLLILIPKNSFYGVTDIDIKSVIGTYHTVIEGNLCFSNS